MCSNKFPSKKNSFWDVKWLVDWKPADITVVLLGTGDP